MVHPIVTAEHQLIERITREWWCGGTAVAAADQTASVFMLTPHQETARRNRTAVAASSCHGECRLCICAAVALAWNMRIGCACWKAEGIQKPFGFAQARA